MQTLLTAFRVEFQERMLGLLWRQWTALGVTGQGPLPWRRTPLDPEALLLLSCTLARHDARLFDAMLDWMGVNGRYLNAQRLRRMLAEGRFAGDDVLAAVVATAGVTGHSVKWTRSSRPAAMPPQPPNALFVLPDGAPLPVMRDPDPMFLAHGLLRDPYEPRGVAQTFRPDSTANLLLRLRAFLGVNARCEILAYLLLNGRGSPRAIARACCYYPATVSKALAEMADSGYVVSRVEGRHRHYALASDAWHALLCVDGNHPTWVTWASLFSALGQAWTFLHAAERDGQSPLAQASALRRLLEPAILDGFARSGLPIVFGDDRAYEGEALLPFFVDGMSRTLDVVEGLG